MNKVVTDWSTNSRFVTDLAFSKHAAMDSLARKPTGQSKTCENTLQQAVLKQRCSLKGSADYHFKAALIFILILPMDQMNVWCEKCCSESQTQRELSSNSVPLSVAF